VVFLVTLILSEGKVLKQNADESSKKGGGEGESQKQEESQKGESDSTKAIEATPGEIEPQPGAAQKSDGDGEENKGGEEENPGSSKDGNDDGGIGENVDIDGSGDGQKVAEFAKMPHTEPFESEEALNGSNSSSQGEGTSPPLNHTLDQTNLEAVVSPGDGDGMDEIGEPTQAAGYVQASSFEAASPPSSSSSSSPLAVNLQEPPSIAKDKLSKGDTDPEKVAPDGSKDKVNLEETNIAQKDVEVQSPDTSAKGPNPGSKDVKASESDPDQNDKDKIENEEDAVDDKDTVEVVKEPKIDTPLETDFQKQMSSETKDPPQSNFFSYFIVLAIITIIVYLVFHNKKKILGLIVEGRSGRQSGRRRSGGREYRKLDSNMEDMMETGRETSMRQVIY